MHPNSSMKPIRLLTSVLAATILALPLLAADPPNSLAETEKAAGWQLLFNGKDLTGWRAYKTPEGPGQIGEGWTVKDGLLKKLAGVKGGDIIIEKIRGHIMLTDHNDEAWFRNIKLRELPAK
jgi:hypothetical protein